MACETIPIERTSGTEYDAPTPQRNPLVRTAFIGSVYDFIMFSYFKIAQLRN